MIDKFNVRVYGLLVKDHKILLSREQIDDFKMLKFPGGGLEFGEGLRQAMIRELKEELEIEPDRLEQFYIAEEYVQSKLRANEQVIAVYYRIEHQNAISLKPKVQDTAFGNKNELEFELRQLNESLVDELSFETDKQALTRLMKSINTKD